MECFDLPRPLSGKFKEDFAYPTTKDRMPVILTKAVDALHRKKGEILEQLGKDGADDLKDTIGRLSKLRNELQTNKPFLALKDGNSDASTWNSYLEEIEKKGDVLWFCTTWLYSECYFYRRIYEAILLSKHLRSLDPFESHKHNALITSLPSADLLAHDMLDMMTSTEQNLLPDFTKMIQIALWGNKCDLCMSAGSENTQTGHPVDQLVKLGPFILQDDTESVWNLLQKKLLDTSGQVQLDVVLDNAGFELVSDLCFIDFLVSSGLVSKVRLHGKTMPWFVSDVTKEDLEWTLNKLESSQSKILEACSQKWARWIDEGIWTLVSHDFWCTPYDFAVMKDVSPDLYQTLSTADLIIFKGDLNYRKLTGDFKWDSTVPFTQALRGFHPAPVCTLRTIKCDLVVGLQPGVAEAAQAANKDWMIDGSCSVIQYSSGEVHT